ncbi:MAG: DUF2062 domain-containing protein [Alphaproteobacteria bacterium]
MVFRRRERLPWYRRLIGWVWPRSGIRRGATYVGYRLMRLPGSPYAIAGGFAWGAAVSFTPFIGLHIAVAALASWAMRCSLVAAAIGTAVGNPWTFPFIWAWIYACGTWILGRDSGRPPLQDLRRLFDGLWERVGDGLRWLAGFDPGSASPAASADLSQLATDVLLPMTVGAVPNVVVVWLVFYLPLRHLVAAYQHRRRSGRGRHWRGRQGRAN